MIVTAFFIGAALYACFPTRDERAAFRRRRARLMASNRAPWGRALEPGGALVAPFTIGGAPVVPTISYPNRPEEGNE